MGTEFPGGKLFSGQTLRPEQTLVSPGGDARLHYQSDGNLVVYLRTVPYWSSHTDGKTAGKLKMRRDGNLVLSDAEKPIASTKTNGHPGAMVQLQDDGNFVIYEDPNGPKAGIPIWASSTGGFYPGDVEPEPIEPVEPNRNRLEGVITQNGWQSFDANGSRIFLFCHTMSFFSDWCRPEKQPRIRNSMRIIATKYAGTRPCDVLGYWDSNRPSDAKQWSAWKDKEVTPYSFVAHSGRTIPATPNYWDRYREFVLLHHELGLKIIVDRGDVNAWTRQQKIEHMENLGRFYGSLGNVGKEVIGALMALNEPWQNGAGNPIDIELLKAMIRAFERGAGWLPSVVGLGDPGGEGMESEMPESLIRMAPSPATAIVVHGGRGDHAHLIEHYRGYGYDAEIRQHNKKVWSREPIGGAEGVSVGRVDDPELLCGVHLGSLTTGQADVFMSGPGVFGEGLVEDAPGFNEVARLTEWLPQDVADFTEVIHAGERFRGKRIMAAVDPTRFDQSKHPDGRFVAVLHTVEAAGRPLPCERACSEFKVINPVTGVVERDGPIAVGQTYRHEGKVRLVVGQLA